LIRIARYIAGIIDDGSTLQIGLGRIPNEALRYLSKRRNLGIHSDLITDSILPLLKKGILTGQNKTHAKGKIVASFALGSRALYDVLDGNARFSFHPITWVADEAIIAAVAWYKGNVGYWGYALSVPGALRINLNGDAVGKVTPTEAAEAQKELNEYHSKKNAEQANSTNGKIDDYSGVRKMMETPVIRTKAPQIPSEFIGLYETLVVAATTVSSISEPGMRLVVAQATLNEVIKKAEQTRQELNGGE